VIVTLDGQRGVTAPPAEIADEVELYAREHDRHGTLHLVPFNKGRFVWMARFTLKSDDLRLQSYQKGLAPEPPTEDVFFVEHNPEAKRWEDQKIPLNIVEMGASGVRQFLERGNTWGRGQYSSVEDCLREVRKKNEANRDKIFNDARERSRHRQMDKRRSRLKIPFHRVGIDLMESNQ
jgi:hypothetical protein